MPKLSDKKLNELKDIFAVLNNTFRLKIVMLCSEKEWSITELSKTLNLNYTVTSEYVSLLEKAGLVKKIRNKNKTVSVKSLIAINSKGEIRRIK